MRFLITTALILTIVFCSFGQNTAVMIKEFTAKNVLESDVSAVTEIFQNAVLGTRKFRIVERTGIADILKEQELQLSGATDTKYAVAIGKIVSVNYLFSGSVSKLGNDFYVSVKLINVETAEIEDAWDANAGSISGLGPAVKELALKAGGMKQIASVNALSSGAYVEKTISGRDNITVIDLNDTRASDDDLTSAIRNPEKIRIIRLRNSLVTDKLMASLFCKMTNLEEIDLRNCQKISEDGAIRGFEDMRKLRFLRCDGCPRLGDKFIAHIARCCKELSSLKVPGLRLTDAAFESLSSLSRLTTISYDGWNGKIADASFLSFIKANPSLNYVAVTHNALSDAAVDGMIEYLKAPGIIILDGNNVSAEALNRLKKFFPRCWVVFRKEIMWQGVSIDDNYIRDHISEINTAESISLNSPSITDKGASLIFQNALVAETIVITGATSITDQCIVNDIRYAKKCRSMILSGSKNITDSSVRSIVDALPRIFNLDITGTAVSKDGVDYVKNKIPTCNIFY